MLTRPATTPAPSLPSNSSGLIGASGEVHGGGTSWTHSSATDPNCLNTAHLRCVEVSSATSPTLPPRHPSNAKKAFVTSVTGTGNLGTWADANGITGFSAANAICQARARYAGYANPSTFKAWLTYYSYSVTSFVVSSASPYARPDGVVMGTTRADMLDSKLAAAWEQTETNAYLAGNADTGSVFTGMTASGTGYSTSSLYYCSTWSYAGSSYYGVSGRYDMLDARALFATLTGITCDTSQRLYCVED